MARFLRRTHSAHSDQGEGESAAPFWPSAAWPYLLLGVLLLWVSLLYLSHFDNAFQFDDGHTILENVRIRSLQQWWKIFESGVSFSVSPQHQSYRPLLTLSLALDYFLAGGYVQEYFHAQSFIWFLLFLVAVFLFHRDLLERFGYRRDHAAGIGLFSAAFLGVHPVCAETVNYIIQRGDITSTFFVILSLLAALRGYRTLPILFGLIGCFFKQSALPFGALLMLLYLFERSPTWENIPRAFIRSIPALLASIAFFLFQQKMASAQFDPGGPPRLLYLWTQPYVVSHYFFSFFFPFWLSADSDWKVFPSLAEPRIFIGFGVMLFLFLVVLRCLKNRSLQPISFGILWALLALAPTSSVFPWAEVMNDHRMFFPFVGVSLAATTLSFQIWCRIQRFPRTVLPVLILLPYSYGTVLRNEVWDNDLSLWADVAEKSPENGRGLMNLGNALMRRGRLQEALALFEGALLLSPNYPLVEVNLGVVTSALGRQSEAQLHFERALRLGPQLHRVHYFYAKWLFEQKDLEKAAVAIHQALELGPKDASVKLLASSIGVERSLAAYERGAFREALRYAQEAIQLNPQNARAWNNLSAAALRLSLPQEALRGAEEAIRLDPGLQNAQGNREEALRALRSSPQLGHE